MFKTPHTLLHTTLLEVLPFLVIKKKSFIVECLAINDVDIAVQRICERRTHLPQDRRRY